MKCVPLAKLEDKIIRPGFDEHLKPLLMYRGQLTLGRAHRLWNMMVSAMEHEATYSDITQRLLRNPDYSQLCGPETKISLLGLRSFCGRLVDNPKVLGEMPHLKEYVEWLLPDWRGPFLLQPISEITHRRRNMGAGGWRTFVDRRGREHRQTVRGEVLEYPFLIHDGGKPEHDLLRKVVAAIPRHVPQHLFADMCQDLVVGILSGDYAEDDLNLPGREVVKRVWHMFPTKYNLSLDDIIPGTDASGDPLHYLDMVADEGRDWA
jgi:hypothetical protein